MNSADDILDKGQARNATSPAWSKVGERNSVFGNASLPQKKDAGKESKKQHFAPPKEDYTNIAKQVAADIAGNTDVKRDLLEDAEEGSQYEVLNNGSVKRKIPAEIAEAYGLDQDAAHRALCAAAASKDAKQQADADSILHILTPKQIVAVVDGSTVGGLYRRLHVLMREIVLPAGGFTSKDQADIAVQLSGADRDLRKHLSEIGVNWPKYERVRKAIAMKSAFDYAKKKLQAVAEGHPPRPVGRPAKTAQHRM